MTHAGVTSVVTLIDFRAKKPQMFIMGRTGLSHFVCGVAWEQAWISKLEMHCRFIAGNRVVPLVYIHPNSMPMIPITHQHAARRLLWHYFKKINQMSIGRGFYLITSKTEYASAGVGTQYPVGDTTQPVVILPEGVKPPVVRSTGCNRYRRYFWLSTSGKS